MREILFRGKRGDNQKWVYGYYTEECASFRGTSIIETLYEDYVVIPETIGQYVGLIDKNSKKIFEGDIVNIEEHETMVNGYYQIIYSEKNHCYALKRNIEYHYNYFSFSDLNGFAETSEIVGNIYDNPELLEV